MKRALTFTHTYTTAYAIGKELAGKHDDLRAAAHQMTAVQQKYGEVQDVDGQPTYVIPRLGLKFEATNDLSQLDTMLFQWRELIAGILEDRGEISAIEDLRGRIEAVLAAVLAQPITMEIKGFHVTNIQWAHRPDGRYDIRYTIPKLFGAQGTLEGIELPEGNRAQLKAVRVHLDRYLAAFADMAVEDLSDPVATLARDMQGALPADDEPNDR